MVKNVKVNLVIIQPGNHLHSLALLDVARYFRFHLRRMGATVFISKNRLYKDAINIIFGAHLGVPKDWLENFRVIIANLGEINKLIGQSRIDYITLLRENAVIEHNPNNISNYRADVTTKEWQKVPVFQFDHAPYLKSGRYTPLETRPIDLLFIGSMNEYRKSLVQEIQQCGVSVSTFDSALYGPERDHFILQSKAILDLPSSISSDFDQPRAFNALSLGTPVISIRTPERIGAFGDSVCWINLKDARSYFNNFFLTDDWYEDAARRLNLWESQCTGNSFRSVYQHCLNIWSQEARSPSELWRPKNINLGSGRDYIPGWLNIDVIENSKPDVIIDLSNEIVMPLSLSARDGRRVILEEDSFDCIYANNVLEHVRNLTALMSNLLRLLRDGGKVIIEVPYEKSLTAWQDPTHVRAMNENSWIYYTDWFWYLGWFENRFEVGKFEWLNPGLQECSKENAAFMRVELIKVKTTFQERNTARIMQANFGSLPDDSDINFEAYIKN